MPKDLSQEEAVEFAKARAVEARMTYVLVWSRKEEIWCYLRHIEGDGQADQILRARLSRRTDWGSDGVENRSSGFHSFIGPLDAARHAALNELDNACRRRTIRSNQDRWTVEV
jgi:hypothetical protein